MLFHETVFIAFITIVILLYFTLWPRMIIPMLAIASYFFYGWAKPEYTILLFISSLGDMWIARYFYRFDSPRTRGYGVFCSFCLNFGMLGYFKYGNFAIENVRSVLLLFGFHGLDNQALNVILPVGISFYTFQTFSYTVDVLTRKMPPCNSFFKYMLYVSWFPQLVAGPIERAGNLLPQMRNLPSNTNQLQMLNRMPEAILLFSEGWLRKSFADMMAMTANAFFNDPSPHNSGEALIGILAFGFQIYGDFSGYTRMAQGLSWLFGVRLMENFNFPYSAIGFSDFWRRWHISLSTWLRDYLYIPLGGNRKSTVRTHVNLMLTMLLGGLWHGASWNFVLWGGLHGLYLVTERAMKGTWEKIPFPLRWVVVFISVYIAWVPFRAPNISATFQIYKSIFHGGFAMPSWNFILSIFGLLFCDLFAWMRRHYKSYPCLDSYPEFHFKYALMPGLLIALCVFVWLIKGVLWNASASAFIYFQF